MTGASLNFRSQITDLRSQITDLKSQISDRENAISDLRSQISDQNSGVPGIQVRNLSKSFVSPSSIVSPSGKTIPVLRDVSFSVACGEIVAITGASGAGKSTLLHLLGGLDTQDSGAIDRYSSRSRAPSISLVFQFHYLLPDLTALENVSLPLRIVRMPASEAQRLALRSLESVGLGERSAHRIGDLSGGEQQRIAVVRALITEPEIVLADEPTGNLDTSIATEIGALLADYARQRQAVVVVATHNEQLAGICDRVLKLHNGQISAS